MDGGTVRAGLLQIDVKPDEPVESWRSRVAALVRGQSGADLVVLPEQVVTADLDPARVAETRRQFPVLRDRVLGLPTPSPRP